MKESFERDLNHAWMLLEVDQIYQEDYQMRMLMENDVPGLLTVCGQGQNENSRYRYEISGKVSMKVRGEREAWKAQEIENFMKQFVQMLYEVENYLLDVNCLSLDPAHIYMENDTYYFCYCPALGDDIRGKFHVLTEYFVRQVDYEDKEAIYLSYELHKASMEENYNVEQVLEGIWARKEKEMEHLKPEKKDGTYNLKEEILLDDWVSEQELKGNVVRDRMSVWGFVSQRVKKRKERSRKEWEEGVNDEE